MDMITIRHYLQVDCLHQKLYLITMMDQISMLKQTTGYESGGSAIWEWEDSLHYTNNVGESATWRIKPDAVQAAAGRYYVYAWIDD